MLIHIPKYRFALLLLFFVLTSCAPNMAYHTNSSTPDTVATAGIKKAAGIQHKQGYDLTFVEFTDRGNAFDRSQMDNVLALIDKYAKSPNGVSVITYVHGWHHNASPDNETLASFNRLLSIAADKGLARKRKLIGVYIGWRGALLTLPAIEYLTYWDRKKVAHDVGKGGITELLLRMEKSLYKGQKPTKNVMINTAHSMGGAILLSALKDILISRLIDTEEVNGCVKTKPFGHSTLLINPAVEANKIFPLEEVIKSNKCYDKLQSTLLHIISSEADFANNVVFKVGQWLDISWRRGEVDLTRRYNNKTFTISEKELDTTTIANFPSFHTARVVSRSKIKDTSVCARPESKREECYIRCRDNDHSCVDKTHRKTHIPVAAHEPISFVYTDKKFMNGHNDVFQPKIAAYIATITERAQHKKFLEAGKSLEKIKQEMHPKCITEKNRFNYTACYDSFRELFEVEVARRKGLMTAVTK